MHSKPVASLWVDLDVAKSHSRPCYMTPHGVHYGLAADIRISAYPHHPHPPPGHPRRRIPGPSEPAQAQQTTPAADAHGRLDQPAT